MPRHSHYIRPYFVLNRDGKLVATIKRNWNDYKEPRRLSSGRLSSKKGFYIWTTTRSGDGAGEWMTCHMHLADAVKEARGNGYRVVQWDGEGRPEADFSLDRADWLRWKRGFWSRWDAEEQDFVAADPRRGGSR